MIGENHTKDVIVNKPYAVVEVYGSNFFKLCLGEYLLKKYKGYPEENILTTDLVADVKNFEDEYFKEKLHKKGRIMVEERDNDGCKNITIKEIVYKEFN